MATAAAVSHFLAATFPRSRQINSGDRDAYSHGFACTHTADLSLDHVRVAYHHGDEYATADPGQEKAERARWLRQYQEVLERRYDVQFADNSGEMVLVVSDRVNAQSVISPV